LQHRRLSELFFRDDTDDDNDKNKKDEHAESILLPRSTTTTVTFKIAGLELQRIHASPHIYVIEHFLKDTEIAYFADKIIRYAKFQKSFVDQDHHHTKDHNIQTTTTSSRYDENRTSSFVSFPKQHDKTIHTIEQRAANILGCYSTHTIEPIQLVRYQKHQFFGTHHDLGMYDENERTVLIPPKSILSPRRRLVTFFVYLNSVERGGATYFPIPNVRIQPIPGRAVLFSNVLDNAQPDPRTIHAGEIVQEGIKYGLNIWICEE
jgi:prolyl 4-hydroxylase